MTLIRCQNLERAMTPITERYVRKILHIFLGGRNKNHWRILRCNLAAHGNVYGRRIRGHARHQHWFSLIRVISEVALLNSYFPMAANNPDPWRGLGALGGLPCHQWQVMVVARICPTVLITCSTGHVSSSISIDELSQHSIKHHDISHNAISNPETYFTEKEIKQWQILVLLWNPSSKTYWPFRMAK